MSDAVLEPSGEDSGEAGTVSGSLALDVQDRNLSITGLGTTTNWVGESTGTTGGTGGLSSPAPAESSATRSPPPRRARSEVVVLLPALNEEQSVGRVIDRIPTERLRSLGYDTAVWVVDGQSVDKTMEVARARGASTFVQTGNGKGNGMRQALSHLLTRPPSGTAPGSRFFVMLDADGTYPAEEIPRFVEALESGEDVVLGSRLRGSIQAGAMTRVNFLGNRILSGLASFLYRIPVTDVCTGMWGFREYAFRGAGLAANGFDFEADLFASACERGVRVTELPIAYGCRMDEPKLIPLRTGIVIAWRLLMRRLNGSPTESLRGRRVPTGGLEEAA